MKKAFTYRLILFLILVSSGAVAQVTIPDPNFKQFLVTHPFFSAAMNPDETLNPSAALGINGQFQCSSKNISNLSGIEYFKNITSIEVKKNPNLHTIPDISQLTSLTIIGLDSNALTSLPDLSTQVNLKILSVFKNQLTALPSLSNMPQLEYLLADNNKLSSLPSLSALINLKTFTVCHNKLTHIPSINGLSKLEHFEVDDNLLTSLPDLTSNVKLYNISCNDNPITHLPSFSALTELNHFRCQRTQISSIPDLNNCTQLEYLICTDNAITELPPMNNCTALKQLKIFRCTLNALPDISLYPNLYSLMVYGNDLSFEDLLPLSGHSQFPNFELTPQSVGSARSIGALATAPFTLELNFDNAISTNSYSWYKNGNFLTTTTQNKLSFSSLQFSDAGVYTCIVTNSTMSGVVVNTAPITLTVGPCIMANTIQYSMTMNDCSSPIKISLDETSFTGGTKPFAYTIKNQSDSADFPSKDFSIEQEGVYDLIVKDQQGCKVRFPEKVKATRPETCDPVFYPNGDGIADTYYIADSGSANIYNRAGEIVKRLTIPAHWDGTNTAGKELPSGLYVIEINGKKSERVTLLR